MALRKSAGSRKILLHPPYEVSGRADNTPKRTSHKGSIEARLSIRPPDRAPNERGVKAAAAQSDNP